MRPWGISRTAGGATNDAAPLDYLQREGVTMIADSMPAVMQRSREMLGKDTSKIKGDGRRWHGIGL